MRWKRQGFVISNRGKGEMILFDVPIYFIESNGDSWGGQFFQLELRKSYLELFEACSAKSLLRFNFWKSVGTLVKNIDVFYSLVIIKNIILKILITSFLTIGNIGIEVIVINKVTSICFFLTRYLSLGPDGTLNCSIQLFFRFRTSVRLWTISKLYHQCWPLILHGVDHLLGDKDRARYRWYIILSVSV